MSLLWSFVNPTHERRVCELARTRHPDLPVFSGFELHPTIREYERTMVAVLNAFCGNALDGIETLANTLADEGLRVPMLLLQANGGTITLDEARRAPLVLNSSGPSAGVVAAAEVAGQAGFLRRDLRRRRWHQLRRRADRRRAPAAPQSSRD